MEKVKITQVKSKNGSTDRQIATLASLGLRRMHQTVEREVNDVTKGMIEKIRHLVKIEEVVEKVKATKPRTSRAKKIVETQETAPAVEAQDIAPETENAVSEAEKAIEA
ncbi:MAG: 50S ribosomal protein L30 [Prevotellaceae bacterium]|jgi:large subunit ribosomal protein L30|nr:50S ribosomal protein L30 [Prevotellaceae bacterium]